MPDRSSHSRSAVTGQSFVRPRGMAIIWPCPSWSVFDLPSEIRGPPGTNATELAALKLKGERNYVDITLTKKDKSKRFADITLTLKSVDPKKNTYTVDVMADDKLTAKKDKSLNEPVQFYTAKGGHTPYEIVINKIAKDQIVGYLSTPKDASSR